MSVPRFFTRAELFRDGWSRRGLTAAVRHGRLLRLRRDHYALPDTPPDVARAMRVGGRITCLSMLSLAGVFVLRNDRLHVHFEHSLGRMRSPEDRGLPLRPDDPRVELHWQALAIDPGSDMAVARIDALAHSVRCQQPRAAIATLDSALHLGFISIDQLDEVFALLPAKHARLRVFVDGVPESGPESLLRLLLRHLGCDVRLQVWFDGVGRVDFLVDGWLVIEVDSREFHSDWATQLRDRHRDLSLAAKGSTLSGFPRR